MGHNNIISYVRFRFVRLVLKPDSLVQQLQKEGKQQTTDEGSRRISAYLSLVKTI